jgi:hypothetical protein
MPAFDHKHYVPCLRAKMGEFVALRELTHTVKSSITPILEIPERDWDFENEEYKKTIDEHINRFPGLVADCWGTNEVFIDAPTISPQDSMASGAHPMDYIFSQLAAHNVAAIPVTGPYRDPAYQNAVRTIAGRDGRGVCIRIQPEDLQAGNLASELQALIEGFGLSSGEIDLILDLDYINAAPQLHMFQATAISFLTNNALVPAARTLTLLSAAFPVNLGGFGIGISSTPRTDWQLWGNIIATPNLPRLPSFGDYAIGNPDTTQIDPRIMRMSASIRYTSNDEWYIFKGYAVNNAAQGGASQYHSLCQNIVGHSSWCGRHFSWGDQFIYDVANHNAGPGNGQSWRQAPTNHHLHFVVEQISNLP